MYPLKDLRLATSTRISVFTARNRLRGARLIFEFLNLNFDMAPLCNLMKKKGYIFRMFCSKYSHL